VAEECFAPPEKKKRKVGGAEECLAPPEKKKRKVGGGGRVVCTA